MRAAYPHFLRGGMDATVKVGDTSFYFGETTWPHHAAIGTYRLFGKAGGMPMRSRSAARVNTAVMILVILGLLLTTLTAFGAVAVGGGRY